MDTYDEFLGLIKKAGLLGSVSELLEWDQEVMMPKGAIVVRAKEKAVVASLAHELLSSPRVGELLAELKTAELDEDQATNVRELVWDYERAKKVPSSLVHELEEARAHAVEVWKEARAKNDFSLFAPELKKVVDLTRRYAQAIDPTRHPYEVLVEDYENDLSVAEIQSHFDKIKPKVIEILKRVQSRGPVDLTVLNQEIDQEVQEKFNEQLLHSIGYDFTKGRVDTSVHPFTACFGRITTRYTTGWFGAISGTMHEAGHAMYEHGLPLEHYGTPRGAAVGLSVHESQSRLWENHVGKSKEFWKPFFPVMKEAYGLNADFDHFYKAITHVHSSFIRVEADEVTYPLHVILRFELEKALFAGEIQVEDLPRLWNQKMGEYLGVVPETDTLGVLQDTHWASGLFGYFPTYVMGSMIAAQLFAAAERDIPGLNEQIEQGLFDPLHQWLVQRVHSHGRKFRTKELVRMATGKDPSPDDYLAYFERKYG